MISARHLYVHIPFCRSRCPYCDYAVHVDAAPDVERWQEILAGELTLRERAGTSISDLRTVLIGGGTPSVLGHSAVLGVRSLLSDECLAGVGEWTMEANPEDVDSSLLSAWVGLGVTRVTIGIQSLAPKALEWLGRTHTPEQGLAAMEHSSRSDLSSWGIDLLFGLPRVVAPNPETDIEAAIAMGVPHISLYELVAEAGTPLGDRVRSGEIELPGEEGRADEYLFLSERLRVAGYEAYEMTGFALPGHVPRHALAVLDGRPWLGLGPGAHSYVRGRRSWNLADWPGYSSAVAAGQLPEAYAELHRESPTSPTGLWFRLRQHKGIPVSQLSADGCRLAHAWMNGGLAVRDRARLRLTPEGWLRLDELAVELARVEAGEEPSPGLDVGQS